MFLNGVSRFADERDIREIGCTAEAAEGEIGQKNNLV
jgi:hypothetical protein